MKNNIQLVKQMYPCQEVPVIVFDQRCPNPCLYCDLYQKKFADNEIIASGLRDVIKKAAGFKGAYFSAVTDCFLPNNKNLTHELLEELWTVNEKFVPLIVTKQVIPEKTIQLVINNKHRCVVQISIPSINNKLVSILEPGSATVPERLETIKKLASGGVPVIAVVMPWLDVYGKDETIEDLPRQLANVGILRCLIGTGVLPEKQRQKMIASGEPLVISAVKKMTVTEKVTTKTGETLPLEQRVYAFDRLIKAFNKYGIKARICTADNPDLINNSKLSHCKSFKHPLFRKVA